MSNWQKRQIFTSCSRNLSLDFGLCFVAHNVKFDANLLAEKLFLEGYELRTPLVDTVELSQVFIQLLKNIH